MANFNLGTASGEIVLRYDSTGEVAATKGLDNIEKKSSGTGAAFGKVASVAGKGGLLIAAGLGVAVKSAADFEERMAAVGAVSGASSKDMDSLRKLALQLGKDTKYNATEAASSIEELVKAGVSVPDIMNGAAKATTSLAAAGEIDLPHAATIASNAMNQFGISGSEMPHVADLIAGAANASAIDVGQFGYSLSQVGAVAHLAGLSFDDTAVAIAEMGNAGIVGSDAGTSLKTMLMRLQPTTDKAAGTMEELGLITEDGTNKFYDQQGKLKSLAQIQGILGKSLQGMTKQQKQAALTTIFGSDAIRGAAVLADQGTTGFNKMAKAMSKVTAADVAAKRMDNLKGKIELMKGSIETAGIIIGTTFIPIVTKLVTFIGDLVDKFGNLSPATQKIIGYVLAAAAAALLFTSATIKVTRGIQSVVETAKVLGPALKLAFGNPYVLIIVGLVALGIALYEAYKHSETFRNIVNASFKAVQSVVGPVVTFISDLFTNTLIPAFQSAVNYIKPIIQEIITDFRSISPQISVAFQQIFSIIKAYIGAIIAIVRPLLTGLLGIFRATFPIMIAVVQSAFILMKGIIQGTLNIIAGIIKVVTSLIRGDWSGAWEGIKQIFNGVWQIIMGFAKAYINVVKAIIQNGLNVIKAIFSAAWGVIKGIVSGAFGVLKAVTSAGMSQMKSVIGNILGGIKGAFTSVFGAVTSTVSSQLNRMHSIASSTMNGIKSVISTVLNGIKATVSSILGIIVGIFTLNWSKVNSSVSHLALGALIQGPMNAMNRAVESGLSAVIRWFSGLLGRIKGAFGDPGSVLYDVGRDIMQGLANGIQDAGQAAIDKAGSIASGVKNKVKGLLHIGSPSKDFIEIGNNIVQGLAIGIEKLQGQAVNAAGNVAQAVSDVPPGTLSAVLGNGAVSSDGTAAIAAGYASQYPKPGAGAIPTNPTGTTYNTYVTNPPQPTTEKQIESALKKNDLLYSGVGY